MFTAEALLKPAFSLAFSLSFSFALTLLGLGPDSPTERIAATLQSPSPAPMEIWTCRPLTTCRSASFSSSPMAAKASPAQSEYTRAATSSLQSHTSHPGFVFSLTSWPKAQTMVRAPHILFQAMSLQQAHLQLLKPDQRLDDL